MKLNLQVEKVFNVRALILLSNYCSTSIGEA